MGKSVNLIEVRGRQDNYRKNSTLFNFSPRGILDSRRLGTWVKDTVLLICIHRSKRNGQAFGWILIFRCWAPLLVLIREYKHYLFPLGILLKRPCWLLLCRSESLGQQLTTVMKEGAKRVIVPIIYRHLCSDRILIQTEEYSERGPRYAPFILWPILSLTPSACPF